MENPEFLKKRYDLQTSPEVQSAVEKTEAEARAKNKALIERGEEGPLLPEKISQKPAERIQSYLDRLESIINPPELVGHPDFNRKERNVEMLKRALYGQFVIKPEEIPESYFELQKKIARERGQGEVEVTDEMRRGHAEVIIADQESTLDKWIDYLTSDDATYPDWLKYYAMRSVLAMGEYDKEEKQFTKRSKGTVKPFPDLNREAFAYVLDAIEKKYKGEAPNLEKFAVEDREKFQKLLQGENFAKLYAWAIEKVTPTSVEKFTVTEGKWVKYAKESDHMPLVNSLQAYGTGWCTAGESTAENQLKRGDFYVYYSLDETGEAKIPRVAIRMEGQSIAELRGVANEQNLDPYIGPVVQEKLKEFPDGRKYEKKSADMKRLTALENKQKNGGEFSKEDITFLYEFNTSIDGFGYQKDPRIEGIISKRDKKGDLSFATGIDREFISTNLKEALTGKSLFHLGELSLGNEGYPEGLVLPRSISGGLYLGNLLSSKGITLPEDIAGDLDLRRLAFTDGLVLPQRIGGKINLSGLLSAGGFVFPEKINGDLNLENLKSAKGLTLPKHVAGNLNLEKLISAEGLTLPETIDGDLKLNKLTSAKGLVLPQSVAGGLVLSGLISVEGLTLPESIGGPLWLSGLTSAKGLALPRILNADLFLGDLTSARGLVFPETIKGTLNLESLTSAEGLTLPKNIGGDLDMRSVTSVEGLTLPQVVGYKLDLRKVAFAKGLTLPKSVGEASQAGNPLDLSSLTSTEGVVFPERIGGELYIFKISPDEKEKLKREHPNFKIYKVPA